MSCLRSILLPVSYLLMSLPSKGQNLSTNQISSPSMVNIIILWLRYNDYWFGKQTSTILEFYVRFRFRPFRHNRRVILHQAADRSRRQRQEIFREPMAISPELLIRRTRDLRTEFRPRKAFRGWSAITPK